MSNTDILAGGGPYKPGSAGKINSAANKLRVIQNVRHWLFSGTNLYNAGLMFWQITEEENEMLRLYDYLPSGNGYKVRLLLTLLGLPFELVERDITKGETRTPEYLAKNPNGRIPLLEVEEGDFLPESNAIMFYLAEGTRFLPESRLDRARVLQWMFFEQYSHEPNIAVARFWLQHTDMTPEREAMLPAKRAGGYAALGVMESRLSGRNWFVGDSITIADIALYAYTHVAHEGGFDLGDYPAVCAWLGRVAAQPGYIPITQR